MLIPVIVLLALVVLAVLVFLGFRAWSKDRGREEDRLLDHETETLEYLVPLGQDPAVLVAALQQDGFSVVNDPMGARQRLVIDCPTGTDNDRPHVRAVIKHAGTTGLQDGVPMEPVDVAFEDER